MFLMAIHMKKCNMLIQKHLNDVSLPNTTFLLCLKKMEWNKTLNVIDFNDINLYLDSLVMMLFTKEEIANLKKLIEETEG